MKILQSNSVKFQIDPYGVKLVKPQFKLSSGWVSPYAQAPWCRFSEKGKSTLIDRLSGDFFCMPYGWNATPFKKHQYPLHGEVAQEKWKSLKNNPQNTDSVTEWEFQEKKKKSHIQKRLELQKNHLAIYQTIQISKVQGPMTWGTHPMIQIPENQTALISLSPFSFGSTFPGEFLDPASGGYSSLKGSAIFKALEKVPLKTGLNTDLSQYPNRSGFDDMVIIANKPNNSFTWSCIVFPDSNFLWYSLKRTTDFPLTILWFSNGGIHSSPWNGQFKRVLAIEEVIGMPQGIVESVAPNIFQKQGIKTYENLSPNSSRILRHIQGVCEIPARFTKVKSVVMKNNQICFTDQKGKKASTPINDQFFV